MCVLCAYIYSTKRQVYTLYTGGNYLPHTLNIFHYIHMCTVGTNKPLLETMYYTKTLCISMSILLYAYVACTDESGPTRFVSFS